MLVDIILLLNYNLNTIIELTNNANEENEKVLHLSTNIIISTLKSLEK